MCHPVVNNMGGETLLPFWTLHFPFVRVLLGSESKQFILATPRRSTGWCRSSTRSSTESRSSWSRARARRWWSWGRGSWTRGASGGTTAKSLPRCWTSTSTPTWPTPTRPRRSRRSWPGRAASLWLRWLQLMIWVTRVRYFDSLTWVEFNSSWCESRDWQAIFKFLWEHSFRVNALKHITSKCIGYYPRSEAKRCLREEEMSDLYYDLSLTRAP